MKSFVIKLESGKEIFIEKQNQEEAVEYASRYDINRGYNFTVEETEDENE